MPLTPLKDYVGSQVYAWERSSLCCPTPSDFGHKHTASEYSFSSHGEHSTPLPQSQSGQLHFLDHVKPDDRPTDDEHTSYRPYIVEWRVTLSNQVLVKDTEQALDSAPSLYWQQIKHKAKHLLRQKINHNQRVKPDDGLVMVSINDCSQHDLIKHFGKTDINWITINRQIRQWQVSPMSA